MAIRSEEEATERALELQAWKELVRNEAWVKSFYPRLERAAQECLNGLRDRTKTAEQRTMHVEASHLAEELEGFARAQIEALESTLTEWSARREDGARRSTDPLDH